jgi:hypothetical protein
VILGALGVTAISVVLLTFGAALGLTGVSPYPYAGFSAKGLAALSATYSLLSAVSPATVVFGLTSVRHRVY